MKCDQRTILLLLVIVALIYMCSSEAMGAMDISTADDQLSPAPVGAGGMVANIGCALDGGMGLASALLPKEVATEEDFGEFAPNDMLKGANYLDPRSLIGMPETAGGALRNGNQQVRSELPNPRTPVSIFNTSTIVPDQMRPSLELGGNCDAQYTA